MKELFKVFGDYSLKISISSGVYFMGERIGWFDYIKSHYGEDYHFVPEKDDPDNIDGFTLFNKEDKLREFFDRKSLWFKQIKEQKRTEQLKEDFK
jgi:hypothetical protein